MYSQLIQEIKRRILEDYNTGDEEYDAIAQGALASLLAYAEGQQKMPKDLRKESQEYLKTLSESPYNTPVANYAGDPLLFPDRDQILEMVDAMRDSAPVAYTLDVGVLEKDITTVVECHRFFSCGLYGFSNPAVLPYMFSQAWFEIKNINNPRHA